MSAIGSAASRISVAMVAGRVRTGRSDAQRNNPGPLPRVLAHERNEADLSEPFLLESLVGDARHADEVLQARVGPDRNHEAAADHELLAQLPWHVRSARRHDDRVVRGVLRPAEAAVTMEHLDVVVSQGPQATPRQLGQRLVSFDGIDVADHPGQHRRCVPRPGADLEHPVVWPRPDGRDHEGHDVWLGDRLAFLDRQRGVVVGELRERLGHERLSRDSPHGVEHPGVAHAARRDLIPHHVLAQGAQVRHAISPLALVTVDRHRGWFEPRPARRA